MVFKTQPRLANILNQHLLYSTLWPRHCKLTGDLKVICQALCNLVPPTLVLAASWRKPGVRAIHSVHSLDKMSVAFLLLSVCLYHTGQFPSLWGTGVPVNVKILELEARSWNERLRRVGAPYGKASSPVLTCMGQKIYIPTYIRIWQSKSPRMGLWVMWIRRGQKVSVHLGAGIAVNWQQCPEYWTACHPPLDDSMNQPCLVLWPDPTGDELTKWFIYNATLAPQILHSDNKHTPKENWCDTLSGSMLEKVSPHSVIYWWGTLSKKAGGDVHSSA